jgi:hypothetical protein
MWMAAHKYIENWIVWLVIEIPLATNLRGCYGSYILNGVVPPLLSMY